MGSKNNPKNRGDAATGKQLNGKTVKPVLYIGTYEGHGTYMAVMSDDGKMVLDNSKKPIAWDSI
jgi:hypothetical protein